ncbi:retrovirus-related pol polyprotein from transposon TNT 1-94, partial [Tanacetum coccineum]
LENQLNHKVKIIRCDNGTEFKNCTMNELCAKKGIKREFSVARTPQQNGVAERKNRTLIEAARTMLADSLLPILFWVEAVNTACYVLNRVLVTKPQNKTPYELLIDEGYLLGYSTKRSGPDWMFDLDFLTNTMNYIPVSVENHVTVDAGTQEPYAAGSSGKDKETTQEYILLQLHPHRTRKDVADKEEQHQMSDAEQALQDELEKMVAQAVDDATRQSFKEEKKKNASTKKATQATSTNTLSTVRPFVNTTNTNNISAASTPTEDDSDAFLTTSIFNGAYDDEDVGTEADFNNMDNTIDVIPIPTLRIHKVHPKDQILGDPKLAIQTRGRIQKASTAQQALNIIQALQDESWVEAMQEELLQFKLQKVWVLVDLSYGKKEEGIDYDEVFAPVAKIEAIRLFLAFASYMGFTVYQIDVKSAFIYGTIREEVYVHQPPGFVDPAHPNKVYKVIKALYGLHQAPRAWYETLSSFLLENGFRRGTIDKTLFIKKNKRDIITATTPIESNKPLVKDEDGVDVDVHIYRYLKHQPKLRLWYPKDSPFELKAYSDSDYGGASLDRKSTIDSCQFLGRRLISWQCKKQTIMANSTTEAEYVVAANCCGQVLWIQNLMMDYGFNFMNTKIHIDNESTISVIKNPVAHSRTKHIEIQFHFIGDCYEKRLIEVIKIHTDHNVADLLTKGFDITRFNFLVVSIGLLNL